MATYKYMYLVVDTNDPNFRLGQVLVDTEDYGIAHTHVFVDIDRPEHRNTYVSVVRIGAIEDKLLRLSAKGTEDVKNIIKSWLWARLKAIAIAADEIAKEVDGSAEKIRKAAESALKRMEGGG